MKVFRSALQSINQNTLRSVLAGFGIGWGIFLLVIFLGIGNGFKIGVMKMFNSFAQKSLFVYGGRTSVPNKNLSENTLILFDNRVTDDIRQRYSTISSCSPEMISSPTITSYEGKTISALIKGVNADYFNIKILEVKCGRSINTLDDRRARNVTVIGENVQQTLFGEHCGLGNIINIGNSSFKVIGVIASNNLFSMQERNSVYIPASSFVYNFNSDGNFSSFCLSMTSKVNTGVIEKDLKGYLAYHYGFDAHDEQALYIANIEKQTSSFENLFHSLEILIWIIGICLLLSGIVSVSNVMLIIVKERTNEIGIRKAVGATSSSIIKMIVTESVTITFLAGIVGIVSGTLVVLLADNVILPLLNTTIIDSLKINVPAVITALAILCLSGVAAGLIPAIKAAQIQPIDAIRYENRG